MLKASKTAVAQMTRRVKAEATATEPLPKVRTSLPSAKQASDDLRNGRLEALLKRRMKLGA